MKPLLDSFWRAAAYCLHPRVIVLSLLPLVVMAALTLGLGYFFWESSVEAVRRGFESIALLHAMAAFLDGIGVPGLGGWLAPTVVVLLTTPVIVVLGLLLVAAFMTPAVLNLVAARRFPLMARKHGGSFTGSVFGAVWATLAALLALLVSVPLWLVPPLVLILPPLIWGWLAYRVMSYDVLAEHASVVERRTIMKRHRLALLGIGVATGYLGAAPSLVWASGLVAIALAPVLVPVAVWIYTLVFAFSALWFAHYSLAALQALRGEQAGPDGLPPRPSGTSLDPLPIEDARRAGQSRPLDGAASPAG